MRSLCVSTLCICFRKKKKCTIFVCLSFHMYVWKKESGRGSGAHNVVKLEHYFFFQELSSLPSLKAAKRAATKKKSLSLLMNFEAVGSMSSRSSCGEGELKVSRRCQKDESTERIINTATETEHWGSLLTKGMRRRSTRRQTDRQMCKWALERPPPCQMGYKGKKAGSVSETEVNDERMMSDCEHVLKT